MSQAQIDLLCTDAPVTVFTKTDSVKDGKGKEHKFDRPSTSSMVEMKKKFGTWGDVRNPTFDLSGFSFS